MKLLSQLSILREYRKAGREIRRLLTLKREPTLEEGHQLAQLRGIQQALGWALDDNAMAPVRAALFDWNPKKKRNRSPRKAGRPAVRNDGSEEG